MQEKAGMEVGQMPVSNALNGLGTHFLLVSHSNVSEAKQRSDIIKTTSVGNLAVSARFLLLLR